MASTPVADAPKKKLNLSLTEVVPFALCHVVILGAFYTGVTWQAWALCFGLLFVRMWGVTAGYHRYFSHRTYKTSRVFQFLLAFLAQTTAQKGVLWWASHHRNHHKHSDQVGDTHSPVLEGFWYSHMGWLFDNTAETDFSRIQDFAKYPELMWLNKYFLVPPTLLAIGCSLIAGWPGLIIGFFLSTVLCWHITFLVNSLAHVSGKRRFETTDQSRNNWFIAMLTLGEGWHNNHHHYQSSTRQGFYWWEWTSPTTS
jgi:stearoyl-CoA desaturase (delta-9 desaturase)